MVKQVEQVEVLPDSGKLQYTLTGNIKTWISWLLLSKNIMLHMLSLPTHFID